MAVGEVPYFWTFCKLPMLRIAQQRHNWTVRTAFLCDDTYQAYAQDRLFVKVLSAWENVKAGGLGSNSGLPLLFDFNFLL